MNARGDRRHERGGRVPPHQTRVQRNASEQRTKVQWYSSCTVSCYFRSKVLSYESTLRKYTTVVLSYFISYHTKVLSYKVLSYFRKYHTKVLS